jgi:hypothetical protein
MQRNTMLPDVTEIGKSGPGCIFRRFPSLTPAMPVLLVKKAVDYLESRAVER